MKLILKTNSYCEKLYINLKKKSPQIHCCIWGDSKYNLVDMKSIFSSFLKTALFLLDCR